MTVRSEQKESNRTDQDIRWDGPWHRVVTWRRTGTDEQGWRVDRAVFTDERVTGPSS